MVSVSLTFARPKAAAGILNYRSDPFRLLGYFIHLNGDHRSVGHAFGADIIVIDIEDIGAGTRLIINGLIACPMK